MLSNVNAEAHLEQTPQNAILFHKNRGGFFQLTQPLKYRERHWAINLKNPEEGNFATLEIGTVIKFDGENLRFAHGEGEQKFYHKDPFFGAKFRDGNGEWKDIYIFGVNPKQLHTSLDIIDTENTTRKRALGLIEM